MEKQALGRVSVLMPDGSVARVERTAAAARTDRLILDQEDRDDVMDEVYGGWWCDGPDVGFRWWDDEEQASAVREQGLLAQVQVDLLNAQARVEELKEALRELGLSAADQGGAAGRLGLRLRGLRRRRGSAPAPQGGIG